MIRLAVSVEGQTEEEFVNRVLSQHLLAHSVAAIPILLGKARTGVGGGNVSRKRLVSEMVHLCNSFDAVTSLVDFYGFGKKEDATVEQLESQLREDIQMKVGTARRGIVPYVQKHEFEGLLFSDTSILSVVTDAPAAATQEFGAIRAAFPNPEDINDNRDTAPSRRIVDLAPKYRKRLHGPLITEQIGLEKIRAECPRFNTWLGVLETLNDRLAEGRRYSR